MDIQRIMAATGSSGALAEAAEKAGIDPGQARSVFQGVLEHVGGGGGIVGCVSAVAAKTGIAPEQVEAFLPQVMPLVMGHAANDPQGAKEILGAFLSSAGGSPGGGLAGLIGGLF